MGINTEQATLADAAEMAPRMRAADVEEVLASGGYTPLAALEDAILMSRGEAWTTRYNGEIMGIWGVVTKSLITGEVIPWLLTSDLVDKHPKVFYKICRNVIWAMRRRYLFMSNRIDERHQRALRWAKRLGFQVEEKASAFGASGRPFVLITMEGVLEHV